MQYINTEHTKYLVVLFLSELAIKEPGMVDPYGDTLIAAYKEDYQLGATAPYVFTALACIDKVKYYLNFSVGRIIYIYKATRVC